MRRVIVALVSSAEALLSQVLHGDACCLAQGRLNANRVEIAGVSCDGHLSVSRLVTGTCLR